MSGTYNEVQVKKLGQKNAVKAKNSTKSKSKPGSQFGDRGSQSAHVIHGNQESPQNPQNPQNPQHSQNSQASVDGQGAAWPPSLQDFVNRSFEQSELLSAPMKATFNEQIQTLIYAAARDKKIWTNDWTLQKLPIFDSAVPLALYQDVVIAPSFQNAQSRQNPAFQQSTAATHSSSISKHASKQKKKSRSSENAEDFTHMDRKRQRAARFKEAQSESPASASSSSSQSFAQSSESSSTHVIGTSTALEKRYLRLTSEPDPRNVRPEHMLVECLAYVVNKYRTSGASYAYINDQLKAIRQDMTVQHITSELAMRVYETHGRIAIENNDLGEFNQCQSQLKHLYAQRPQSDFYKHTYEFMCYRILYLLLTGNFADINLTRIELIKVDSGVAEQDLEPEFQTHRKCVYKALQLADHVVLGNYHAFFVLYRWYETLDCMAGAFHLLSQFMANKQRVLALNTMCKAFKKVPLSLLELQLAVESASNFLADFGLQHFATSSDFDSAAARAAVQGIVDQGSFKKVDIKGQV